MLFPWDMNVHTLSAQYTSLSNATYRMPLAAFTIEFMRAGCGR